MDWVNAAEILTKVGLCEPLFAALAAKGCGTGNQDGDKSKWDVRMHDGSRVSILCKNQNWWDFNSEKGGRSPVLALSHILGLSPPEAARWIVEHVEGCPAALALRESLELGQASKQGGEHASSSPKKSLAL